MRPKVRLDLAPHVLQLPFIEMDVGLGADEGVLKQVFRRGAELRVLYQAPVCMECFDIL